MLRHLNRNVLRVSEKKGSKFLLENGKSLIDISGGSLTQNFSSIDDICNSSTEVLCHIVPSAGFESEQKSKLQKCLIELCNGKYEDMLWSSSGSDAVESGIWAANTFCKYKYGKEIQSFVVRKGSYHGNTELCRKLSTRASGGSKDERVFVIDECPSEQYSPFNEGSGVETFLNSLKNLVESKKVCLPAVVVLEGKPTTGWKFNSDGAGLKSIVSYCREQGMLVVLDDVASGAFRHGTLLSCGVEEDQLLPDISIISKGLTSGLHPLSCALLSSEVTDAVKSSGVSPLTFTHGLTEFSAVIANNCVGKYLWHFKSEASLKRVNAINYIDQKTRENLASKEIGISVTATSIRLDLSSEQAEKFASNLVDFDMWAYIGTSVMKKRGGKQGIRKYAHICPAFDLDQNTQNEIFKNLIQILSNQ